MGSGASTAAAAATAKSVHEFTVTDINGEEVKLSKFKGKVLLIVNVASACGLTTRNYKELAEVYSRLRESGLEILAFPCNQFGGQESGTNEQIKAFACTKFRADYPIFDKIDVNGSNSAPLYQFLKASKGGGIFGDSIKWNFAKFLVNHDGIVIDRYAPTTSPKKIEASIKKLLGVDGSRLSLGKSRGRSNRGRVGVAGIRSMGDQDDPSDFRYIQLWVSEDGESHIKDCKMTGFKKQAYSSLPQYVKEEFGGKPTNITFTELSVGMEQPLHTCPKVQFVVTLSGSWYIKTTDGAKYVFKPGEVLFQDNTADTPAKSTGEHLSGVVGDVPCQQFIVQFDRAPEVDNPNPF